MARTSIQPRNTELILLKARRRKFLILSVLAIVVLIWLLGGAYQQELTGKVVGVSDGDSFTLVDDNQVQRTVRLAYVDAPELAQKDGQAARKWLMDKIYQRPVRLVIKDLDKYGRLVSQVWVFGVEINLELLRAGHAWHYIHFTNSQSTEDYNRYQTAQTEAKKSNTGLWRESSPLAPWEYRKMFRDPYQKREERSALSTQRH